METRNVIIRGRTVLVLLVILSLVVPVWADEKGDEKSLNKRLKKLQKEPLLDQILQTMDKKYADIKSLEVTFDQTKNMMLLAQPVHSKGLLVFQRPGDFYWRFNNPDPTVMVLKGTQMLIHYPDLNQADILEIEKYKQRVAKYLGLTDSMMKLKRYYDIKVIEEGKDTYLLELKPERRRIKQKIELLEVWLSRDSYLPVKIQYREPNGDSTVVKITKTVVNGDLDAALFDYKPPEGTKINYPLKDRKYKLKKGSTPDSETDTN